MKVEIDLYLALYFAFNCVIIGVISAQDEVKKEPPFNRILIYVGAFYLGFLALAIVKIIQFFNWFTKYPD